MNLGMFQCVSANIEIYVYIKIDLNDFVNIYYISRYKLKTCAFSM